MQEPICVYVSAKCVFLGMDIGVKLPNQPTRYVEVGIPNFDCAVRVTTLETIRAP